MIVIFLLYIEVDTEIDYINSVFKERVMFLGIDSMQFYSMQLVLSLGLSL